MSSSTTNNTLDRTEELLKEFISLYLYERLGFLCSALTFLPPLEQRFVATYVEALCRIHAESLTQATRVVNTPQAGWVNTFNQTYAHQQSDRLRLVLTLALLENERRECADQLYVLLLNLENVIDCNQMKPVDSMSSEIMSLLVMACSHSAFTWEEKQNLHDLILKLSPLRDSLHHLREEMSSKSQKGKTHKSKRYCHKATSTDSVTKCHVATQCNVIITADGSLRECKRRDSQFSMLSGGSAYDDHSLPIIKARNKESWCDKWLKEHANDFKLLEDGKTSLPNSLVFYNSSLEPPYQAEAADIKSILESQSASTFAARDVVDDGNNDECNIDDVGVGRRGGGSIISEPASISLSSMDWLNTKRTCSPWRLTDDEQDSSIAGDYPSVCDSDVTGNADIPMVYQHYSPLHTSSLPLISHLFLSHQPHSYQDDLDKQLVACDCRSGHNPYAAAAANNLASGNLSPLQLESNSRATSSLALGGQQPDLLPEGALHQQQIARDSSNTLTNNPLHPFLDKSFLTQHPNDQLRPLPLTSPSPHLTPPPNNLLSALNSPSPNFVSLLPSLNTPPPPLSSPHLTSPPPPLTSPPPHLTSPPPHLTSPPQHLTSPPQHLTSPPPPLQQGMAVGGGDDGYRSSCCNCGQTGHTNRTCGEPSYKERLALAGQTYQMKF